MYKITSNGTVVGVFENPTFIRLRGNGCYVPCDENQAEGVCVKVPKEVEDEIFNETTNTTSKENRIVYEDTVYRFGENNLIGTEPICTIEKEEKDVVEV